MDLTYQSDDKSPITLDELRDFVRQADALEKPGNTEFIVSAKGFTQRLNKIATADPRP